MQKNVKQCDGKFGEDLNGPHDIVESFNPLAFDARDLARFKQELEVLEKSNKESDVLLIQEYIEIKREIISLLEIRFLEGQKLSPEQSEQLLALERKYISVKKAILFCQEFINFAKSTDAEKKNELAKIRRQKQVDSKEHQKRLEKQGELTILGQEKVIRVSAINAKTLAWLKPLMDVGIFDWEDKFAFNLCDEPWILKAASRKSPNSCFEMLWELMCRIKFFPDESRITALAERIGTPSVEELTKILGHPKRSVWLKMVKNG